MIFIYYSILDNILSVILTSRECIIINNYYIGQLFKDLLYFDQYTNHLQCVSFDPDSRL